MPTIEIVPVRAFKDNYIWTLVAGGNAAVVDPGDAAPVLAFLDRRGVRLTAILNTHHHADHVGGNAALLERFAVPVYGPCDERIPTVSRRVGDGERITVDGIGLALEVLAVPAHTRSHIAFHGDDLLFCGDTLFAGGCGRIFEGTPREMHAALTRLGALPERTRVFCGHEYTLANLRFARAVEPDNPVLAEWEREAAALRAEDAPTLPSTIGRERAANPFLRCDAPGVVASAGRRAGRPLADAVAVLAEIRDWKNNF